jgi:hypothetical protein
MQEFFELEFRNMTMDKYETKVLELMRCVGFIKEEKVNIQRLLSALPSFFKQKIQFDEPKTLEETTRKVKYLYDHNKGEETF